jgi:hypothetical protein
VGGTSLFSQAVSTPGPKYQFGKSPFSAALSWAMKPSHVVGNLMEGNPLEAAKSAVNFLAPGTQAIDPLRGKAVAPSQTAAFRFLEENIPNPELLKRAGVNVPGGKAAGRLAFDIFSDPTTYITLGGASALKQATRPAAKLQDELLQAAKAQGRTTLSPEEMLTVAARAEELRQAVPRKLSMNLRVPGTRSRQVKVFETAAPFNIAGAVARRTPAAVSDQIQAVSKGVQRYFTARGGADPVLYRSGQELGNWSGQQRRMLSEEAKRWTRELDAEIKANGHRKITGQIWRAIVFAAEQPEKYRAALAELSPDYLRHADELAEKGRAFMAKEREAGIETAERPNYVSHRLLDDKEHKKFLSDPRYKNVPKVQDEFFVKPGIFRTIEDAEAAGFKMEVNPARLFEVRGHASINAISHRALDEFWAAREGVKQGPKWVPSTARRKAQLADARARQIEATGRRDVTPEREGTALAAEGTRHAGEAVRAAHRTRGIPAVRKAEQAVRAAEAVKPGTLGRNSAVEKARKTLTAAEADVAREAQGVLGDFRFYESQAAAILRSAAREQKEIAEGAAKGKGDAVQRMTAAAETDYAGAGMKFKNEAEREAFLKAEAAGTFNPETRKRVGGIGGQGGRTVAKDIKDYEDDVLDMIENATSTGTTMPETWKRYVWAQAAADALRTRGTALISTAESLPARELLEVAQTARTAAREELRVQRKVARQGVVRARKRLTKARQTSDPKAITAAKAEVTRAVRTERDAARALGRAEAGYVGDARQIGAAAKEVAKRQEQLRKLEGRVLKVEAENARRAAAPGHTISDQEWTKAMQEWDKMPTKAFADTRISPEMREDLLRAHDKISKVMRDSKERHAVIKLANRLTARWKALALLSPGYHGRNFQNDALHVGWAGARNPRSFLQAERNLRGKSSDHIFYSKGLERNLTVDEAMELARVNNVIGQGQAGFEIQEALYQLETFSSKAAGKSPEQIRGLIAQFDKMRAPGTGTLAQLSRRAGQHREDMMRGGLYIELLKRGDDPIEAARVVREFLFDYNDVSRFVADARRFWLPFITFTSKAVPLTLKGLAQNPGRYANIGKTMQMAHEEAGSPELPDLPVGSRLSFGVPLPNAVEGFLGGGPGNPITYNPERTFSFGTLNQVDPTQVLRQFVGGMANPGARTAAEVATNFSFYRRGMNPELVAASGPALALGRIPGASSVMGFGPKTDLQTGQTYTGMNPRVAALLSLLPLFGQAGQVTPTAQKPNIWPGVGSFGLGVRLAPYDVLRARYYSERSK